MNRFNTDILGIPDFKWLDIGEIIGAIKSCNIQEVRTVHTTMEWAYFKTKTSTNQQIILLQFEKVFK